MIWKHAGIMCQTLIVWHFFAVVAFSFFFHVMNEKCAYLMWSRLFGEASIRQGFEIWTVRFSRIMLQSSGDLAAQVVCTRTWSTWSAMSWQFLECSPAKARARSRYYIWRVSLISQRCFPSPWNPRSILTMKPSNEESKNEQDPSDHRLHSHRWTNGKDLTVKPSSKGSKKAQDPSDHLVSRRRSEGKRSLSHFFSRVLVGS